MKIKINVWAAIVFILLVLSDLPLKRAVPVFAVPFIIYIILKKGVYKNILKCASNLILIVIFSAAIGLFMVSFRHTELRKYLSDIFTLASPIILIVFGFLLYKGQLISKYNLIKAIIYAGLFIAVYHIFLIAIGAESTGAVDQGMTTRGVGGNSSDLSVFSLMAILFAKDESGNYFFSINTKIIFSLILLLSIFLYFSRINLGSLFLGLLIFVILFKKYKSLSIEKILKAIFVLIASIIAVAVILIIIPDSGRSKFLQKIENSYSEAVSGTGGSHWTYTEMTESWRAYEVYRVRIEMKKAGIFNKLFGFGAGKKVSLGVVMNLGGHNYSEISAIHNGYYYIMLKNGYLGVILYLLFMLKQLFIGIRYVLKNKDSTEVKLLIFAVIYVLFTTYFVAGVYNQGGLMICCVIMGYFTEYLKCSKNELVRNKDV